MAKYIIEIPDEHEFEWVNKSSRLGFELCFPINETATNKKYYIPTGLKLESYTESDRKAIEDEVWDLAKKIGSFKGLTRDELNECFGHITIQDVMTKHDTYQEAKAKYDAWKKEKEEIHVGDEVESLLKKMKED